MRSTRCPIVHSREPTAWKAHNDPFCTSTIKRVDFAGCRFDFAKDQRPRIAISRKVQQKERRPKPTLFCVRWLHPQSAGVGGAGIYPWISFFLWFLPGVALISLGSKLAEID